MSAYIFGIYRYSHHCVYSLTLKGGIQRGMGEPTIMRFQVTVKQTPGTRSGEIDRRQDDGALDV